MNKDKNQFEETLIKDLKNGDHNAFKQLVDIYYQDLYRTIFRVLKNVQDTEDTLQEVFVKISKYINRFEGRSSLSTWIYKITINESLMFIRKKKPQYYELDSDDNKDDIDEFSENVILKDWCCIPEKELLDNEAKDHLENAINGLSLNLRLVFIMRDINGFSVKETAKTLSISESVVKTRLFRARMKLRKDLDQYFSIRN